MAALYALLLLSVPDYGVPAFANYLLWNAKTRYFSVNAHVLGAILIVGLVVAVPVVRRPLHHVSLRWLGRVSFGLYLMHVLVIMTVGVWVLESPSMCCRTKEPRWSPRSHRSSCRWPPLRLHGHGR